MHDLCKTQFLKIIRANINALIHETMITCDFLSYQNKTNLQNTLLNITDSTMQYSKNSYDGESFQVSNFPSKQPKHFWTKRDIYKLPFNTGLW